MYKEIIEKFMPSFEMKNYLKTVELSPRDITGLVAFSPFALDDKLEGLCKLKEYADANMDLELSKEAESYIRSGKKALALLSEEGVFSLEVFSVEAFSFDRDKPRGEGHLERLFGTFEEVIDFCHNDMKPEDNNPYDPEWHPIDKWLNMNHGEYDLRWYTVKKWMKDSNEKYGSVCTYIVVRDKIWFYRIDTDAIEDGVVYKDMYDGRNLDLPVPFKTGDILEINGFPFGPKFRALVLGKPDIEGYCHVRALRRDEDGLWSASALQDCCDVFEGYPMISPFYTSTIYNGYL